MIGSVIVVLSVVVVVSPPVFDGFVVVPLLPHPATTIAKVAKSGMLRNRAVKRLGFIDLSCPNWVPWFDSFPTYTAGS